MTVRLRDLILDNFLSREMDGARNVPARPEDALHLAEERAFAGGQRLHDPDAAVEARVEVLNARLADRLRHGSRRRSHGRAAHRAPALAAASAAGPAVDDHLAAAGRERETREDRQREEGRPPSNRRGNAQR